MKKCPVCDRENFDDALTCVHCRRYLPQTNHCEEYSLVTFLKKNESLFTIMGVFLVLALIFNSPQFISLITPQSNAVVDHYVKSSMLFAFLCLWISIIIFFVIFFDLIGHLRIFIKKIKNHLINFKSKEDFLRDSSIIIIIPPLGGIALMFFELLLEGFPEYSSTAFLINILEIFFIEILLFLAILISVYIKNKNDKIGIIAFSITCFIIGGLIMALYYSFNDYSSILLIPALFLLIIFGILSLIRFFKIKNGNIN